MMTGNRDMQSRSGDARPHDGNGAPMAEHETTAPTAEHETSAFETILVETRGRVGWITLNRPEALNALNTQVCRDVVAAASAFDADEQIGAIVLTGSERAFAAGADIKEME